MSLLLIRHGETAGNASGVIQFPETPLNDTGLNQATLLAKKLSDSSQIDGILTSDYRRALDTAEKISVASGINLSINKLLRERDFGDLRGKSYSDMGNLDIFSEGYIPPGGESWESFHVRVDAAWEEIVNTKLETEGTLVVVTHGLVLRALIERKLTVPPQMIRPGFVVANTSVTLVEDRAPWNVKELAVIDHLLDRKMARGMV